VWRLKIPRTSVETARYLVKSGAIKIASGHRRSAHFAGMAERMPKALASYEAEHTTERLPRQATTTGLPRNFGSSRCSTEAYNASMSAWMILRVPIYAKILCRLSGDGELYSQQLSVLYTPDFRCVLRPRSLPQLLTPRRLWFTRILAPPAAVLTDERPTRPENTDVPNCVLHSTTGKLKWCRVRNECV